MKMKQDVDGEKISATYVSMGKRINKIKTSKRKKGLNC